VRRQLIHLFLLLGMPLGVLGHELPHGWIRFSDGQHSSPIGRSLFLLKDPTGELGIRDVVSFQEFKRSEAEVPNLGISNATHWARFSVVNTNPTEGMVLLVDYPEIEQLDIYLEGPNGIRHLLSDGQSSIAHSADQPPSAFSCPLDIPYGGTGNIYLRVASKKQLQLPLFLVTARSAEQFFTARSLFLGAYMGIMLVMLLYNLFLFVSIKDNIYLLYIIYILFVAVTQLSFIGYLGYYAFP